MINNKNKLFSTTPKAGHEKKLNQEKINRLKEIQERENVKGLLISKFLDKFQGKSNRVDPKYVDKLVSSLIGNEHLSEETLRELEKRINVAVSMPDFNQAKQETPKYAAIEAMLNEENRSPINNNQGKNIFNKGTKNENDDNDEEVEKKSVYRVEGVNNEWASILKYNQEVYEMEKLKEKRKIEEQKKKMKEELDKQIEEKKKIKQKAKEELDQVLDRQRKFWDEQENKFKQRAEDKLKLQQQDKLVLDSLLKDTQLRKKQDKLREKQEIDEVKRKNLENQEEDQRKVQSKIEKKIEYMKIQRQEAEEKLKYIQEKKLEQKLFDKKKDEEFKELLQRQETQREREKEMKNERIRKIVNFTSDHTEVENQKRRLKTEEDKITIFNIEKSKEEKQKEDKKRDDKEKKKEDIKKVYDQQIEIIKKKKLEEKNIDRRQLELWQKDKEENELRQKRKLQDVKEGYKLQSEYLKHQIEEKIQNKNIGKMNKDELLLNKSMLKSISNDPNKGQFVREIVHG